MFRASAHLAALGTVLLVACGSPEASPLPVACLGEPSAIRAALQRAPQAVRLADGTPLSRCVSQASAGDLQTLGVRLTRVADDLRARAGSDPAAALQLGYLVGAVRRGAALTPGIAAQLARRVERAALPVIERDRSRAQLERGMRLGQSDG
ncbi:MAG: hypothetical protein ACR2LK_02530 [Solirubrobacteraceae bacterium]